MDTDLNLNSFRMRIFPRVISWFLIGFILIGVLIFLPAGTIQFMNGWLYITGLLIPMIFALGYLLFKDPELLEKRINMREKEEAQKKYVKLSMLILLSTFIIPGLDFRFGWSDVPLWLSLVSLAVMVCGYVMFFAVMLQNRYASRVIEIQHEQKLIDTGLYSLVRHPMYLAATILYLPSPLVLGSYWALIPMAMLPFLLSYRIINEEKVLINGLAGYEEYRKRVKYRMIPFVW